MADPTDITKAPQQNIVFNIALMEGPKGKYVKLVIQAITGMTVDMDIPGEAAEAIGVQLVNHGKLAKLGLTIVDGQ